jgi:glycosyltransferase involved in cell wall biosynthesis
VKLQNWSGIPSAKRTMTIRPLVDVAIVTYNHEEFIAQAIESVLAQETDFPYRLIVGDDCSSDNTQTIVKRYAERYPDRITTLLYTNHLGIVHKERLGIKILGLCTAKYVALLDGDDYWTSAHKLQEQVNFLESYPDFAICFHNVTVWYEDGSQPNRNFCPPHQKNISTLEDLLDHNFIPTCSAMFRSGLCEPLPNWFSDVSAADWALHILNAQHGKIGYIDQVMATYRIHHRGFWMGQHSVQRLEKALHAYGVFDKHLNFKYHETIAKKMIEHYNELAHAYEALGNLTKARSYARQSFIQRLRSKQISSRYIPGTVLGLYAPALYWPITRLTRSLKRDN